MRLGLGGGLILLACTIGLGDVIAEFESADTSGSAQRLTVVNPDGAWETFQPLSRSVVEAMESGAYDLGCKDFATTPVILDMDQNVDDLSVTGHGVDLGDVNQDAAAPAGSGQDSDQASSGQAEQPAENSENEADTVAIDWDWEKGLRLNNMVIVPEPSTLSMLAIAGGGILTRRAGQ